LQTSKEIADMPVIGINFENTQVVGAIGYDLSVFSFGETFEIGYAYDITVNDLLPIQPISASSNWLISWRAIFKAGNFFGNTSKFKSAIGKYDFGYADYTSLGAQTYSEYLNYQQQSSPVFSCWASGDRSFYPADFSPPSNPGGDFLVINPLLGQDGSVPLSADSGYYNLTGCSTTGSFLTVFYFANLVADSGTTSVYPTI